MVNSGLQIILHTQPRFVNHNTGNGSLLLSYRLKDECNLGARESENMDVRLPEVGRTNSEQAEHITVQFCDVRK